MSHAVQAVLLAFAILSVKHAIADFFLQTPYQYRNKGIYGHPGGLLHAGIHALLSLAVFAVLPVAVATGALVIAGEYVIHYHVDWAKEQCMSGYGLKPSDPWFWHALGLDQLAHALTYVGMVSVLAGA